MLYNFTGGSDGSSPAGLVIAGNGVLYGTTFGGGDANAGTVFALTPPATPDSPWIKSVVYTFAGSPDGSDPVGPLVIDGGTIYGTTRSGGTGSGCFDDCGTVFSLTPPLAPGGAWTESVLYRFSGGSEGSAPSGIVLSEGVIYGITIYGGTFNDGIAFSLTPPLAPGGDWTEAMLASFDGVSGLTLGSGGILYGATELGGASGGGSVFSLTPPAAPGGAWTQTVLHSFPTCPLNPSCYEPTYLYSSDAGVLYGLTIFGGANHEGSVYSLTRPAPPGQAWTYSLLHSFDGSDGADPDSLVVARVALYGTTGHRGGAAAAGTVFSLQR
jgi:uncharacterized repeat protein (TIGR03803 family)